MGIGFVVITNENEAEKIMETLKDYCNCQIIGKVTDDEKITVKTFEGSEVTYWFNNYKESEKMKIMKDNEIALVKEILRRQRIGSRSYNWCRFKRIYFTWTW